MCPVAGGTGWSAARRPVQAGAMASTQTSMRIFVFMMKRAIRFVFRKVKINTTRGALFSNLAFASLNRFAQRRKESKLARFSSLRSFFASFAPLREMHRFPSLQAPRLPVE